MSLTAISNLKGLCYVIQDKESFVRVAFYSNKHFAPIIGIGRMFTLNSLFGFSKVSLVSLFFRILDQELIF